MPEKPYASNSGQYQAMIRNRHFTTTRQVHTLFNAHTRGVKADEKKRAKAETREEQAARAAHCHVRT